MFSAPVASFPLRSDRQEGSDDDAGRIRTGFPIFRKQAVSHPAHTGGHRFPGSDAGGGFAVNSGSAGPTAAGFHSCCRRFRRMDVDDIGVDPLGDLCLIF